MIGFSASGVIKYRAVFAGKQPVVRAVLHRNEHGDVLMLNPLWTKRLIESAQILLWADRPVASMSVSQEALLRSAGLRAPQTEAERLLLLGVVEDVRTKLIAQRDTVSAPMDEIIEFIRGRTRDQDLSRATVAALHGRSDSWMSHHFKKEVGVSFQEFVNELRLADGIELLRSTQASVKEIALTVGFKDVTTFPRLFKRRYNQAPAQWRRAHAPGTRHQAPGTGDGSR